MSITPTVSVVMSVYNEEKYVESAVKSILNQTLDDFEFIIIDDCSSDSTPTILATLMEADPRIQIIRNQRNLGLTKSLNIGLDKVNGRFIARMDADDISLPTRLEKQLKALCSDPKLVLCGTSTIHMTEDGSFKSLGLWPDDPTVVKWYSIFRPVVAHPSAMFRREVLDKGLRYDETLNTAQDYDFFSRMQLYGDTKVIKTPLLLYRNHPNNISTKKVSEQGKSASIICRNNLWRTFPAFFSMHGIQLAVIIADFIHKKSHLSPQKLRATVKLIYYLEYNYLQTLINANKKTTRTIQRLTSRWIIQAVFQKKSISILFRLQVLYELRYRIPRLIEESLGYINNKVKARFLV